MIGAHNKSQRKQKNKVENGIAKRFNCDLVIPATGCSATLDEQTQLLSRFISYRNYNGSIHADIFFDFSSLYVTQSCDFFTTDTAVVTFNGVRLHFASRWKNRFSPWRAPQLIRAAFKIIDSINPCTRRNYRESSPGQPWSYLTPSCIIHRPCTLNRPVRVRAYRWMRALHLFAGIEVARNDEKPLRVSRRRGPAASKNVITFPSPRLRGTLFFILEARPARRSACILSIYARAYLGVKRVTATQILPAGFLLDRKAHVRHRERSAWSNSCDL